MKESDGIADVVSDKPNAGDTDLVLVNRRTLLRFLHSTVSLHWSKTTTR